MAKWASWPCMPGMVSVDSQRRFRAASARPMGFAPWPPPPSPPPRPAAPLERDLAARPLLLPVAAFSVVTLAATLLTVGAGEAFREDRSQGGRRSARSDAAEPRGGGRDAAVG